MRANDGACPGESLGSPWGGVDRPAGAGSDLTGGRRREISRMATADGGIAAGVPVANVKRSAGGSVRVQG